MKKVFCLLLAAVMILSFAACGKKEAPQATTPAPAATAPSSGTTSTQPSQPAVTTTPEPAKTEVDWPKGDIEFLVPANPGGDTDATARAMAEALTAELGKTVSVVNMAGGAGTIALDELLARGTDGSTALYWHTDLLWGSLLDRLGANWTELVDVAVIPGGGASQCVFISSKAKWQTIEELIADAKANPGTINFGAGTGQTVHFLGLDIEKQSGAEFNFVSIDSASDRVTALLGGDIDMMLTAYGSGRSYIESGDMRCLAVLSPTRLPGVDVPTLEEATGITTAFNQFYVIAFAKGTDPAIIEKMAEAVKVAANSDVYVETTGKYYYGPLGITGDDIMPFMNKAEETFKGMVETYKAKYGN